jgi:hypothetical protein
MQSPKHPKKVNSKEGFDYTCSKEVKVKRLNSVANCQDLLENPAAITSLYAKIKLDDFLEFVYSLLEAHSKVKDLLDCIVEDDLKKLGLSQRYTILIRRFLPRFSSL